LSQMRMSSKDSRSTWAGQSREEGDGGSFDGGAQGGDRWPGAMSGPRPPLACLRNHCTGHLEDVDCGGRGRRAVAGSWVVPSSRRMHQVTGRASIALRAAPAASQRPDTSPPPRRCCEEARHPAVDSRRSCHIRWRTPVMRSGRVDQGRERWTKVPGWRNASRSTRDTCARLRTGCSAP